MEKFYIWCMRNFIYKITFAFLIISCGTKEVAKKDPLDLAISEFIETYYDEDKGMILDASKSSRDLYFLDGFRSDLTVYYEETDESDDFNEKFYSFFSNVNKGDKLRVIYKSKQGMDGFYDFIYFDKESNVNNSKWLDTTYESNGDKYVCDIITFNRKDSFEGIIDIYGYSQRENVQISLTPLYPKSLFKTIYDTQMQVIEENKDWLESEGNLGLEMGYTRQMNNDQFHLFLMKGKENDGRIIIKSSLERLPLVYEEYNSDFNALKARWNTITDSPKVFFNDAKKFMESRTSSTKQTLIKSDFNKGVPKQYYFYSEPIVDNNKSCISFVDQDSLGISKVSCDDKIKTQEMWNMLSGDKFVIIRPKKIEDRDSYDVETLLENYIELMPIYHDYFGLDRMGDFSNESRGVHTFYTSVCFGRSEYTCQYIDGYFMTENYGQTWRFFQ